MRMFREWLSGWATTLRIMFFERETYKYLRDWSDGKTSFPDNFEEVE